MDARRRPVANAASWRNAAYPRVGDVVDPVFNQVCLVLLVCPSSAVAVRFVVCRSIFLLVST